MNGGKQLIIIMIEMFIFAQDAVKSNIYIVEKDISDGLCGKTDEDNLGFSYTELDAYLSGEINKL